MFTFVSIAVFYIFYNVTCYEVKHILVCKILYLISTHNNMCEGFGTRRSLAKVFQSAYKPA